jgi:fimbrial chaperone protein
VAKRVPTSVARRLSLTILLGLALGQAGLVCAGAFGVSPVLLKLSPAKRTALLTITNAGSEEVRLHLDFFAWQEGQKEGETILEPTDDLVVFPLAATVGPSKSVKIRVGLADRAPVTVERSYRVKVEELPSAVKRDGAGIHFTMIMSVPVFVVPARPRGAVVIGGEHLSESVFRFSLTNPANAHVRLESVALKGTDPQGKQVFSKDLQAWYLLAGGTREYEVRLSPSECAASADLRIEARSEEASPVASQTARPPDGCTVPQAR